MQEQTASPVATAAATPAVPSASPPPPIAFLAARVAAGPGATVEAVDSPAILGLPSAAAVPIAACAWPTLPHAGAEASECAAQGARLLPAAGHASAPSVLAGRDVEPAALLGDHTCAGAAASLAVREPQKYEPPDFKEQEAQARARTRRRKLAKAAEAEAEAEAEAAEKRRRVCLEASTPRPLPFVLPPKERPEPVLLLTGPACGSSEPQACPGVPASRQRRQARRVDEENRLGGLLPGATVEACSEFTGIGGFEHGLEAGFEEAGLTLRLVEASELDDTSSGLHATAVLQKRFPDCVVLGPESRKRQRYRATAAMLTVTPICTQHSGLNADGNPDLTDETLRGVFARIGSAPSLEVIAFENVPNFLSLLEGQERSSYSLWVAELEALGFTEHAFVVMPTAAAGDLHRRSRILSVHTRGAFHPAAALLRLVSDEPANPETEERGATCSIAEETEAPGAACSTAEETEARGATCTGAGKKRRRECAAASAHPVFSFTTGVGELRYAARNRGIDAVLGGLPAYNRGLNVALFYEDAFYALSPWLAARASGLPDGYQDVASCSGRRKSDPVGAETRAHRTMAAAGLANMVSPLQARELGHSIASEWRAPRAYAHPSLRPLADAPSLPDSYAGNVPFDFPRLASLAQPATLCFSRRATGRWHSVERRWWPRALPAATLGELCAEALRRGELEPLRSVVDLQRVVDDPSLSDHARRCAADQRDHAVGVREARKEEADRRTCVREGRVWRRPVSLADLLRWMGRAGLSSDELRTILGVSEEDAWIECDRCGKWRRLRGHGPFRLPSSWTCDQNEEDPRHSSCSAPQELSNDEIDHAIEAAADRFETVTLTLRGAALPAEPPPSSWVACDRCGKWRLALDDAEGEKWYCELSPDRRRNHCAAEEEAWDSGREDIIESTDGAPSQASSALAPPAATAHALGIPLREAIPGVVFSTQLLSPEDELRHAPPPRALPGEQQQQSARPCSTQAGALPQPSRGGEGRGEGQEGPQQLRPALEAEKQVHVDDALAALGVTKVVRHWVYSGAKPGSLHNVYVSLAFSDGRTTRSAFVPSQPLLGSRVLLAYLDSKDGGRIRRYVPEAWSGFHVYGGRTVS